MHILNFKEPLTLDGVLELLEEAPEWYDKNRLYWEGEHWQGGDGWAGQIPDQDSQGDEYQQSKRQLFRNFTSQNAILEVGTRHASAVIGRSPFYGYGSEVEDGEAATGEADGKASLGPNEEEDQDLARLNGAVSAWFTARRARQMLYRAAAMALWGGEATLRLFVPPGFLVRKSSQGEASGGPLAPDEVSGARVAGGDLEEPGSTNGAREVTEELPRGGSFEDALDLFYVEVEARTEAGVHTLRWNMQDIGVYRFEREGEEFAEVSYYDEAEDATLVKIVGARGEEQGSYQYDLAGEITMHTLKRAPLITEQVRQQQKQLNKAHTAAGINMDWTGFLERTFLNAAPPGEVVEERNPQTGNVERRFKPNPMHFGPSSVNFVSGQITEDAEGNERVARPELVYRKPEEGALFDGHIHRSYRAILQECSQLHAMQEWGADISGEAIRQHMADFIVSLFKTKAALDHAGAWLLGALRDAACTVSGEDALRGYEPEFRCSLDPGPIPASEIEAVISLVKENLLSRETGRQRVGVENPEAEADRLKRDLYARLGTKQMQAGLIKTLASVGAAGEEAAEFAEAEELAEALRVLGRAAKAKVDREEAETKRVQEATRRDSRAAFPNGRSLPPGVERRRRRIEDLANGNGESV